MDKLKINHIPMHLFKTKRLYVYQHDKIGINYKTREPQSYFRNTKFLFMNISPVKKVSYLKALSTRRISDNNSKIPRCYFEDISNNVLLEHDNNNIYFPLEEQLLSQPTTKG